MVKVFCVLLVVVVGYLQAAHLPKYIVPCSKSDPHLNDCAKKHGQAAIPFIVKGEPKFKVPNMLPLSLKDGHVSTGEVNVNLTNAKLHGLERAKIEEVHIELEDHHMGVTVAIDRLSLVANYSLFGKIFTVPISRNGTLNITLVDGEYSYHFNYTLKQKMKKPFVQIQGDELFLHAKGASIEIDGGKGGVGQVINELVNDNWERVQNALSPTVADIARGVIKSIVTGFTNKVPVDRIFTP